MADQMRETRCIICGRHRQGLEVNDDSVIRSIRWMKMRLHMKTGYHLVVCKEDYRKYYAARHAFERRRALYIGIGVVLAVLLLFVNPTLLAIIYGLGVILFLYLLSLLNYAPSVKTPHRSPA